MGYSFRKKQTTGVKRQPEALMIKRLVRTISPSSRIRVSEKSSQVLISLIRHVFIEIITNARSLMFNKTKGSGCTLKTKTVQAAVRLTLNGELAKHAVSEVIKSQMTQQKYIIKESYIRNHLRNSGFFSRIAKASCISLSAVMEYIVSEILELAINQTTSMKQVTIQPRSIMIAIRSDEELSILFKGVILPSAGVLPSISHALIPSFKKSKVPLASKPKKSPWLTVPTSTLVAEEGGYVGDDDNDEDDYGGSEEEEDHVNMFKGLSIGGPKQPIPKYTKPAANMFATSFGAPSGPKQPMPYPKQPIPAYSKPPAGMFATSFGAPSGPKQPMPYPKQPIKQAAKKTTSKKAMAKKEKPEKTKVVPTAKKMATPYIPSSHTQTY